MFHGPAGIFHVPPDALPGAVPPKAPVKPSVFGLAPPVSCTITCASGVDAKVREDGWKVIPPPPLAAPVPCKLKTVTGFLASLVVIVTVVGRIPTVTGVKVRRIAQVCPGAT